ncbi:type III PLP-dependent enzyme [Streptomyces sp. NPDC051018]|uniref:type III PLP-dependent enzyme n=1 Tax=Streptomyces sp. NPDC051018 TaxID=3365639 RepID=UPI0037BD4AC3
MNPTARTLPGPTAPARPADPADVPSGVRELALSLPPGGLPAYLYDLDALRRHTAAVRAALPGRVELYYAAKANPDAGILAALSPYVDGYEVSSGGELAHTAGVVPGRPLAFGGPGKTPAEIETALRLGVDRFHVESAYELRMLAHLAAGAPVAVLLRFNIPVPPGVLESSALAMGGRPAPFGTDPSEADDLVRLLTDGTFPGLRWRGVHAHLASGLTAGAQLAVASAVVEWSAALAARHGVPLHEVDVGGGMTVDYTRPDERFDWAAYGKGLARLGDAHPGTVLRIEPGRALTAYCGWYATEVLDVKRSHGETFAVVRGGTHHLRTPATKGHDQPCAVLPVDRWPHAWPRSAAPDGGPVTLVGQLCTPKDVLARAVPAPGLRAGDRVVFALAGAYAWNISHHEFLMHPKPGFHYLGASPGITAD